MIDKLSCLDICLLLFTDPNTESRIPLLMSLDIYVPRDERFGHVKMSDFLTFALKSISQLLLPEFKALFDSTPNEFDSFADVLKIYEGGIKLPQGPLFKAIVDAIPLEILKQLLSTDGEGLLKYPIPQVIQGIYLNFNMIKITFPQLLVI